MDIDKPSRRVRAPVRRFESEPADEWREDYGQGGPVRSDEPERDWFFEQSAAPQQHLEDERANMGEDDSIARTPTAVAANYRGFGPKGYRPRDERLQEIVCERLAEHPHIDATDLSIAVAEGIVTVTGSLASHAMEHAVEDAISDIHGVLGVHCDARVTDPSRRTEQRNGVQP